MSAQDLPSYPTALEESQSHANLLEDLKAQLQDHKQQINLLGLLKTNLLADVTGLQKTATGLQKAITDLQHHIAGLDRLTIERQKATYVPKCLAAPVSQAATDPSEH